MFKTKLILLLSFQLCLSAAVHGQAIVSQEGYEKAVDLANCKYIVYSLTNADEKKKFIENCDCNKGPDFITIQNAISKTKTKTIAFSKVFNDLKNLKINLDHNGIAFFLTDSIFNRDFNSKYKRIFNFGNSRKNDESFIEYKRRLSDLIVITLEDYAFVEEDAVVNKSNKPDDMPIETTASKKQKFNWHDEINVVSISISILLTLLLVGFFYFKYIRGNLSEGLKNYINKKVSGAYFHKRFDQNQSEINKLKDEVEELKNQIRKL